MLSPPTVWPFSVAADKTVMFLISTSLSRVCPDCCVVSVPALTLRLLMSYIYMERIFLMFLDHTQRRTTVGRTPLDE